MPRLEFNSQISIAANPDRIWQTITDPARVAAYHLAPLKVIEAEKGGRIIYGTESTDMIIGKIVKVVPDEVLVHTFRFGETLEGTKNDPETMVSYRIETRSEGTILTVVHSGFPEENQTYSNISGGWPFILEGLKTVAENR